MRDVKFRPSTSLRYVNQRKIEWRIEFLATKPPRNEVSQSYSCRFEPSRLRGFLV
jgi:hypothetical protein